MVDRSTDRRPAEQLRRSARATIGDELRAVIAFTRDDVERVYLREDLEPMADLLGITSLERAGFGAQAVYDEADLGAYRGTIRVFDDGYLLRVVEGEHGVWATADALTLDRAREAVDALRSILRESDPDDVIG